MISGLKVFGEIKVDKGGGGYNLDQSDSYG